MNNHFSRGLAPYLEVDFACFYVEDCRHQSLTVEVWLLQQYLPHVRWNHFFFDIDYRPELVSCRSVSVVRVRNIGIVVCLHDIFDFL
jgi:hypothetical protein